MCYHTHSSPNESIDCVVRCTIYRFIWRGMCVITKSFLIGFQRIDSQSLPYVNKIYRFMWRKGQLLQILSTHSAQHKIYRFIWRKWRFFFSSCKIWIFHGYILAFKLAFLQKFLNQKVQFSTNIMTKQKNLFAKMVRILQIHLISMNIHSSLKISAIHLRSLPRKC